MPTPNQDLVDEIILKLRQEFLSEATETLADICLVIEQVKNSGADADAALHKIRRDAHNLKGMGGSFGFPSITVIAHRLEDYLAGLDHLAERQFDDVLTFLYTMQDITDRGVDPGDDEVARRVRSLPAKGAAKENYQATSNFEILLVAASSVVGRAVEGKLSSRGFRVVTVASPMEAFETVVRTRPDMVIASAMMEGIGGVDLSRALKAMSVTRDIPFVLLTSFGRAHSELRELSPTVGLIHHDRDLDREISNAIQQFGLLAPAAL